MHVAAVILITLLIVIFYLKSSEGYKSNPIRDDVITFFKRNPYPSDKAVHQFANEKGINKHRMEEEIYALLTDLL